MAYRKLGVDNKHRRSMLATLTKQVIMNEQELKKLEKLLIK